MSSSQRILIGLAAGVAVGLFLGERAAVFGWAADGFVKLLQMTVLPYVTLSIVTSLGSLSYAEARTLGIRAGAVLAGLWALALVFAFLIPLAFPHVQTRVVLQHDAGRAAAAVQLRRSLHPVEPVPLARQQRGAGRGAVLRRPGRRADRRRAQADAARRAAGRGRRRSRARRAWPCGSRRTGCSRSPRPTPARSTSSSWGGCRCISSPMWRSRCWSVSGCCPGSSRALTPIRDPRDLRPDARRADHGDRRRRPVHRAAGADRGQQDAARRATTRRRAARRRSRT